MLLEDNFEILIIYKPSPGVKWGTTQNLGPIGSAVLKFVEHKQTDT